MTAGSDSAPLPVYGYERTDTLARGWHTHVAYQRLIHEESARRVQALHYWLGTPAAVLAALAGCSAVAAWQSNGGNPALAVLSAVIGVAASALAGTATFLDLGGRAERHRRAAADYKAALREVEQLAPPSVPLTKVPAGFERKLNRLRRLLGTLDATAPIPPRRVAEQVLARRPELRQEVRFGPPEDDDRGAGQDDAGVPTAP